MGNSTFMIDTVFYGTLDNRKFALNLAGMAEGLGEGG